MATAIDRMLFRPMTPENADILMAGDLKASSDNTTILDTRNQHLTCFAGGMLGLGGKLFSNPEQIAIGKKLTDGCVWAYKAMPWGIMPEIAHFVACESKAECTWDQEKWLSEIPKQQSSDAPATDPMQTAAVQNLPEGFSKIDDKRYILRPEAIESVFIYFRITGDRQYQDHAWDMFTAIERVTATEFANAAIIDITTKGTPQKDDRMESFWLAETLKYLYLILSEPNLISLDHYILNTEAHSFKRPK